mgnify:CR=1 FL=1
MDFMNNKRNYIIAAKRTPFGSQFGVLSNLTAVQLATIVTKEIINSLNLPYSDYNELILGEVLTCGLGQNPARQTAIMSGLNDTIQTFTVNKVCGSGLKSINLADDSIKLGRSQLVIAGGAESMSNAPHFIRRSKIIPKLAEVKLYDTVTLDALTDPFNNLSMSQIAEITSSRHNLTKKQLDDYACYSYARMQSANNSGRFNDEIIPIKTTKRLKEILVDKDEEPFRFQPNQVYNVKPLYGDDGVISVLNSSKINDGAALVAVASEEYCVKNNIKPLVEIVTHGSVGVNSMDFLLAPSKLIPKLLEQAGLTINDIDLFDINEAFATVVLITQQLLNIDPEKINVNGGAISLGHPVGASAARILVSTIYELKKRNAKYGLVAACIGAGEGVGMIIKNVD